MTDQRHELALGHLEVTPAPADLSALLREVIDRFEPPLDGRIVIHAPLDGPVTGGGDSARLGQVLDNLLSNAVKYSPADSPIEIAIESTPAAVRLSVRDQGIGIEPDAIPRLFARYSRVGAEGRAQYQIAGLGVGLYISQQIVDAHGGHIHVTSKPGHGSTFTVTLPVRPGAAG